MLRFLKEIKQQRCKKLLFSPTNAALTHSPPDWPRDSQCTEVGLYPQGYVDNKKEIMSMKTPNLENLCREFH